MAVVDFSRTPFFFSKFESACHSIPAQIPPSMRYPSVCDQLPFHSSVAFLFVFKPVLFYWSCGGHAARGILVPWLGIETMVPAVEALSLNHWTTRELSSIAFCLQRLSGTFHLLPFIFVVSHWFNSHLLLNQIPCGRCYRGQKDETWTSLFIYYFSYSVTTYIKARTVSYSFSSHLLSSFFYHP